MKTYFHNKRGTPQRLLVTSFLPAALVALLGMGLTYCSDSGVFSSKMKANVVPLDIPLSINYKPSSTPLVNVEAGLHLMGSGLQLTSATAGSMKVSVRDCDSGYTFDSGATALTNTFVRLYKLDSNCDVVLREFDFSGVVYNDSNAGAVAFSLTGSLAPNDATNGIATFASSSGDTIKVFLTSDISTAPGTDSSNVDTSDVVTYNFTDLEAGTAETLAQGTVSTDADLAVTGQDPPNLDVIGAYYLATNANGSASLAFTLECGIAQVAGVCDGMALAAASLQFDFLFIPDVYNLASATQDALTMEEVNDAYAAATGTPPNDIKDVDGTNHVIVAAAGSDWNSLSVPNGGFYTDETVGGDEILTGSTPIYDDVETAGTDRIPYVFILRRKDSTAAHNVMSYRYFYVNIAAIVQT